MCAIVLKCAVNGLIIVDLGANKRIIAYFVVPLVKSAVNIAIVIENLKSVCNCLGG